MLMNREMKLCPQLTNWTLKTHHTDNNVKI